MIGGWQSRAGEREDETFQMEQGEHFSVGTSIRLRNAPELRMKGSVLTSEDSLTPVLRRPACEM